MGFLKMRVGINEVILNGSSDGSRQRELNVLSALDKVLGERKIDSVIYLASDISTTFLSNIKSLVNHSEVKQIEIPSRPPAMRVLKGALKWNAVLNSDRCDTFHTSYYPIPNVRQKIALTVNDLRFLKFPETYSLSRRIFLQHAVPRAIQRADLVFSISHYTKQEICEAYGTPPEKIIVTPIPKSDYFQRVEDFAILDRVAKRYSLPKQFLLCVSHLEPRKNIPRIIDAYTALQKQGYNDLGLVILGRKSLRWKEIIGSIKEGFIKSRIIFTGYVADEDMAAIYSLAKILVFPSLHEGFGIPLLEAMACQVPIVTSNTTALKEVAGNAAVLVNPTSVNSIVGGIQSLLTDKDRVNLCKQRGSRRVLDFTAEQTATSIATAYEILASSL